MLQSIIPTVTIGNRGRICNNRVKIGSELPVCVVVRLFFAVVSPNIHHINLVMLTFSLGAVKYDMMDSVSRTDAAAHQQISFC